MLPISLLYWLITSIRAYCYRTGLIKSYRACVPVVVVGNITVGGSGKTPVVIAIVQALKEQGIRPGVISRGYGGHAPTYPYNVDRSSPAKHSGDEPLLIAIRTDVPVVVGANRADAINHLLKHHQCDVIIADDGLQHLRLKRDIEIVVVDAQRQFGNNLLLPAGPLREGVSRLNSVDYIVHNGDEADQHYTDYPSVEQYGMQLQATALTNIHSGQQCLVSSWPHSTTVHAVAGIGNPQRFFTTLRALNFEVIEHSFDDHHHFLASDLQFGDDLPIVMTEKDAVKMQTIGSKQSLWSLPVNGQINAAFFQSLTSRLQLLTNQLE